MLPISLAYAKSNESISDRIIRAKRFARSRERLSRFRTYITRGKLSNIITDLNQKLTLLSDFCQFSHGYMDINNEKFCVLFTLARLHASSYNKPQIDEESWTWAKNKNEERLQRISDAE